jgi:hypothetical protein
VHVFITNRLPRRQLENPVRYLIAFGNQILAYNSGGCDFAAHGGKIQYFSGEVI